MPKKLDYPPRGMTIGKALDLAKIIYNNGKALKIDTFAELISMNPNGGAFVTKYNTLIKYGLIEKNGEVLTTTPLVKKIVHFLDENEKKSLSFKAFINVPLFQELVDKFKETRLPDDDSLDTLLIRQHDVNERAASAVRKGFIKSLKELGVFDEETRNISLDFEDAKDLNKLNEVVEIEEDLIDEKKISDLKVIDASNVLNKDIIDLIIILASNLEPMPISTNEITNIIENNVNLTHVRYPFAIIKDDLVNNEIQPEKIRILLEALMQDLRVE